MDISCLAFDYSWRDKVENKDHALVITEGFLMYVTEEQAKEQFSTIASYLSIRRFFWADDPVDGGTSEVS